MRYSTAFSILVCRCGGGRNEARRLRKHLIRRLMMMTILRLDFRNDGMHANGGFLHHFR